MKYDVVTIGSVLIDVFVQSNEFMLQPHDDGVMLCSTYGDKIEVDKFALLTGGGAGNTAVGFQRQGYSTAVIAEMGTDAMGEMIKQEFESEGVSTELLVQERREETGMSVVLVAPDGGRTILVHRGAATMLEKEDVHLNDLETTWIHVANISGRTPLLSEIGRYTTATTTRWSWNPGKGDINAVVAQPELIEMVQPTVVFVNKEEWQMLEPVQDQINQKDSFVVVTDGKNGGQVLQHGEELHRYSISTATPVDETGAGDAFVVGFVAQFLREQDAKADLTPKMAIFCEAGKKSAASVVQKLGAKAGLLQR